MTLPMLVMLSDSELSRMSSIYTGGLACKMRFMSVCMGCKVCQRDKGIQRQPAGKLVPLPLPDEA